MIKLINIINEIKVIGGITPKMVEELDKMVCSLSDSANTESYDVFIKHGWEKRILPNKWLHSIEDKTILRNLYQDLLQIKQKYVSK